MSLISNSNLKPVQIPDQTSIKEKVKTFASEVQKKTGVCANEALFNLKSTFKQISNNAESSLRFVMSRGGIGTNSQTKAILNTYRQSLKPQETIQGSEVKEQKNGLLKTVLSNLSSGSMASKVMKGLELIENEKNLIMLSKDLDKELSKLSKTNEVHNAKFEKAPGTMSLTGEDKEKFDRLNLMKDQLKSNPTYFTTKMKEHGRCDLCVHMTPVKFLSILVKSDQNVKMAEIKNPTLGGNPHKLDDRERVALYGYTTKDYIGVNGAARKAGKEPIADPGMRSYFDYTKKALTKLPNIPIPIKDKDGNEVVKDRDGSEVKVELKRAIFNPPSQKWVGESFAVGKEYVDHGFGSSTTTLLAPGKINLTFKTPDGAKELPHAKSISEPYSAFNEEEILFEPGIPFKIHSISYENSVKAEEFSIMDPSHRMNVTLQCYPE